MPTPPPFQRSCPGCFSPGGVCVCLPPACQHGVYGDCDFCEDAERAEEARTRSTPEPDPTDGTGPALWELVMADLPAASPLRKDMQERHESGMAKYGKPLRAFNGRNALVDAYQENLDLCVYLRQAVEEAKADTRPGDRSTLYWGLRAKYDQALHMASGLCALLEDSK